MNYYQIRIKSSVLNIAVEDEMVDLLDQMPDEGLPTELPVWGMLADWRDTFLPFAREEPDYEMAVTRVSLGENEEWVRTAIKPEEIC